MLFVFPFFLGQPHAEEKQSKPRVLFLLRNNGRACAGQKLRGRKFSAGPDKCRTQKARAPGRVLNKNDVSEKMFAAFT